MTASSLPPGRGSRAWRGTRARIVLACAQPGAANERVAADLGVTAVTVGKWRRQFREAGLAGLADGERPGRPKAGLVLTDAERDQLTRWARRAKTAQALALRAKIVLACARGREQQAGRRGAADHAGHRGPVAGPVHRRGRLDGLPTSRGRAGRRRSCWTRSKRS